MRRIQSKDIFEQCDEGVWNTHIEVIPGINCQGETIEEAKDNLTDAIHLMFEEK